MTRKSLFIIALLALSACETVEGAGRDLQAAGAAIETTAQTTPLSARKSDPCFAGIAWQACHHRAPNHAAPGGLFGRQDHQIGHGSTFSAGQVAKSHHLGPVILLKNNEIYTAQRHFMPGGTKELRGGRGAAGGQKKQQDQVFHPCHFHAHWLRAG